MVANNFIEVYTLLFAWQMYTGLWDILAGSGLALIPFVAAIFSSAKNGYNRGEAKSAIADLELSVMSMVLVLIMCVIPYNGFGASLSTIKYSLDTPDCQVRALPASEREGTGDDVAPLYDSTFSEMATTTVSRPILWSLVQKLSSAVTHATVRSMGCVNNYSFMLARISSIKIQDQELRERIKQFHSVCYKTALDRWSKNPLTLTDTVTEVENIDWMGSRTLLMNLNEYYRHEDSYVEYMGAHGFTRSTRDSDLSMEDGAHPYCYEVWLGESVGGGDAKGLRELILEAIPVDDAGDVLEDWKSWGSQVMSLSAMPDVEKEDLIIKLIMQADRMESMNNLTLENEMEEAQWYDIFSDIFVVATTFFTSLNELFKAEVMKNMVKVAGPIVIALVQMLIIFTSPIVMVLGKYSVQSFVSICLTYFTLEFINAIWAAAFWFEQRILDLYWSQSSAGEIIANGMIVSMVSITTLFLLPMVWIGIMGHAGASMIRGLGRAGVSSAGTSASIRSGRMLNKGFKAATRGSKGGGKGGK